MARKKKQSTALTLLPPEHPEILDQDKTVPVEHEGKLESNYYCRAWNSKSKKYCKARAGLGTNHKGYGRCKHHDGRPVTNGTGSVYKRLSPNLLELVEKHLENPNPLDISSELSMARAIFEETLADYTLMKTALLEWHYRDRDDPTYYPDDTFIDKWVAPEELRKWIDTIVKTAQKERQLNDSMYISRGDMVRIMLEMGRSVRYVLEDESIPAAKKLKAIGDDWKKIKV